MGHVEKLLNYFDGSKLIAGTALIATILKVPGEVDFVGKVGAGSVNYPSLKWEACSSRPYGQWS